MSRILSTLARNRGPTVGVAAFTALAVALTLLVAGSLAGGVGPTYTYHALFRNASGLEAGDDVRISGVRVGKIKDVRLDGASARVEFFVASGQPIYTSTTARIEFLNLLGKRYIALDAARRGDRMPQGATIPLARTNEGLDLSAIFNAFRPLFELVKPEDVNELAANIVQVLEGQGPTLRSLTEQIATLTNTLVDRDAVIGSVMENLTLVMQTMDSHRAEFRSMIHELNHLTGVIADRRDEVGSTITGLQTVVTEFSSLVDAGEESINRDVVALAAWASAFAGVTPLIGPGLEFTQSLLLTFIKNLGSGSYLNTYVCESGLQVGSAPPVDLYPSDAASRRCQ